MRPHLRNYVLVNLEECLTLPRISVRSSLVVLVLGVLLLLFYTVGAYFIARSMQIRNQSNRLGCNQCRCVACTDFAADSRWPGGAEGAFSVLLSLYAVPLTQAVAFSLTGFLLALFLTAFCWVVLNALRRVKDVACGDNEPVHQ